MQKLLKSLLFFLILLSSFTTGAMTLASPPGAEADSASEQTSDSNNQQPSEDNNENSDQDSD